MPRLRSYLLIACAIVLLVICQHGYEERRMEAGKAEVGTEAADGLEPGNAFRIRLMADGAVKPALPQSADTVDLAQTRRESRAHSTASTTDARIAVSRYREALALRRTEGEGSRNGMDGHAGAGAGADAGDAPLRSTAVLQRAPDGLTYCETDQTVAVNLDSGEFPSRQLTLTVPDGDRLCLVQVESGDVQIGDQHLTAGDSLTVESGAAIIWTADAAIRLDRPAPAPDAGAGNG